MKSDEKCSECPFFLACDTEHTLAVMKCMYCGKRSLATGSLVSNIPYDSNTSYDLPLPECGKIVRQYSRCKSCHDKNVQNSFSDKYVMYNAEIPGNEGLIIRDFRSSVE